MMSEEADSSREDIPSAACDPSDNEQDHETSIDAKVESTGFLEKIVLLGDFCCFQKDRFTFTSSLRRLSVITGRNGSGKSQLLQAILYAYRTGGKNEVMFPAGVKYEDIQICSLVNENQLNSLRKDAETLSKKYLEEELRKIKKHLRDFRLGKSDSQGQKMCNEFKMIIEEAAVLVENDDFMEFDTAIELAFKSWAPIHASEYNDIKIVINRIFKSTFKKKYSSLEDEALLQIIDKQLQPSLTRRVDHLNGASKRLIDAARSLTFNELYQKLNAFAADIPTINMNVEDLKASIAGIQAIDEINQHLTAYEFKYILGIDQNTFGIRGRYTELANIEFNLPNDGNNTKFKVVMSELSQGERILLLFCLWRLEERDKNKRSVILLDEPDAHLHPVAIYELIETMKKLINDNNVQIIMTSHNPVTLTYVPTDCIFLIKNEPPEHRVSIECVQQRQQAIHILNSNLAYVREPFALVLVEGEKDAVFYRTLLKRMKDFPFQIVFRVHGSGKDRELANCGIIESHIKGLTESGQDPLSQFLFGLIDGDNNKKSSERNLQRLQRYSVDNYIFDPINLFLCLRELLKVDKCEATQKMRQKANDVFGEELMDIDCSCLDKGHLQQIIDRTTTSLSKALNNHNKFYKYMKNLINEQLMALNDENDDRMNELIRNIINDPDTAQANIEAFLLALQKEYTEHVEAKYGHDIFNVERVLAYKDECKQLEGIKTQSKEIVRDNMRSFFDERKEKCQKAEENDLKELKNSIFEREIKLNCSNNDDFVSWDQDEDFEDNVVRAIGASSGTFTLKYSRFLLYCRGHNLEDLYQKLFSIPFKLLWESKKKQSQFVMVLSILPTLYIPEDLYNIYKEITTHLGGDSFSSPAETKIKNVEDLPFFCKEKAVSNEIDLYDFTVANMFGVDSY